MRCSHFLSLIYGATLIFVAVPSIAQQPLSPSLAKLDVSAGRWVFHGKTLGTASNKPGSWTWNEDCRWSPNNLFLECTFSNVWSGKAVESLVVDTYNEVDHGYWHYELYASGEHGKDPFVSPMEIHGNTWIEYGEKAIPGKRTGTRIVYQWEPPNRVNVAIEVSKDGSHWTTVDQGEGLKQP